MDIRKLSEPELKALALRKNAQGCATAAAPSSENWKIWQLRATLMVITECLRTSRGSRL